MTKILHLVNEKFYMQLRDFMVKNNYKECLDLQDRTWRLHDVEIIIQTLQARKAS